jgi:hypothetical protein
MEEKEDRVEIVDVASKSRGRDSGIETPQENFHESGIDEMKSLEETYHSKDFNISHTEQSLVQTQMGHWYLPFYLIYFVCV